MIKLKKKNYKIWLSIAVLSAMLTTVPVFANFSEDNIIGTTTQEIDEHGNVKTIITVKNQQIESYTSIRNSKKSFNTYGKCKLFE